MRVINLVYEGGQAVLILSRYTHKYVCIDSGNQVAAAFVVCEMIR